MAWETSTGLLTDYIGTVTAARFKFDARYNSGATLLAEWDVATDNPEWPSKSEWFPCGNGWTTTDGTNAFRTDGGDKFQRNSIYGRILETVKGSTEAMQALSERGDPTDASIWVGTKWRFAEVETDYGGDIGIKKRVMPVEFMGIDDNPQPAQGAGTGQGANGQAPDDVVEALRPIAARVDSHGDFVREAMAVNGAQSIIDKIADDSDAGLFAKLKSGVV